MTASAYIALETGAVYEGRCRVSGAVGGELVFTTAYSGYEESLTDPSYCQQVLTFAYPLIGNYGVRRERFESTRIQVTAGIAREFTDDIVEWFEREGVPAVDHLDTRRLVRTIRDNGVMACGISAGPNASPAQAKELCADFPGVGSFTEIGAQVSVDSPQRYGTSEGPTVVLLDCGVKRSIIDSLVARGAHVVQLPYDASRAAVEEWDPDLLFISNGPGDPAQFDQAERLVEAYAGELPIAGICLGQQIVANALGGTTAKMEFGHRGVNQPVMDHRSDQVIMTTQNHGYTVADAGPLATVQTNVNDGSPEGLEHPEWPIITRQYHPEANPGPHDAQSFFDEVLRLAGAEQAQDASGMQAGD